MAVDDWVLLCQSLMVTEDLCRDGGDDPLKPPGVSLLQSSFSRNVMCGEQKSNLQANNGKMGTNELQINLLGRGHTNIH